MCVPTAGRRLSAHAADGGDCMACFILGEHTRAVWAIVLEERGHRLTMHTCAQHAPATAGHLVTGTPLRVILTGGG